ncbi:hypothetical protein ADUPG1_007368, partial [Aduncisulcus paluster]
HLLGIKIQESTINEVFLADGSPIAVLGTVKIHTSLPGVDGMSMEFEEICLVIEMKGNKQVEFLIGKERILKNDLLDWLQELPEEDDVLIEDELNKEIVSPFDLDNGLWTCEIPELHSKIDSLLQGYCMKIDKNKPASVPEFSLNFPEDRKPIALKCRKVPFHLQNEVRGWIDELLDSHFIVPSRSEFAAPIVLVRKPNGGLRLCCDYTLLNRVTPNDEYPIPRQDMLFSALEGKSIFAALDLKNGYFNIAVDKKSRHQTAFITPWGLFEWNRMPFGLKSAPAHFQRCLNAIFKGMMPQKCLIYLDDILVFGSNEEEFLNNLASVLSRLAEYNLFLNLEKCKIGVRRVRYLGFFISEKGRSVDPKRLEVMRQISPPTSLKELQALVGKLNFLREFIPDYSRAAEPLTRIMRKGYSISEWKEEQSTAWAKILD